ncbi:MAG TPA: hypothetical protein VNH80_01185 [Burkholderiales bacterium]|nr:hypothetical protein [Burkholderiales bacterium]
MLSNEEFMRLTTAQRAEYLRRAVEALDTLRAQMNAEVLKSLRNNSSPCAQSVDDS